MNASRLRARASASTDLCSAEIPSDLLVPDFNGFSVSPQMLLRGGSFMPTRRLVGGW